MRLAPDGHSASAAVGADVPALLILDLGLPDMDGITLLNTLRADGYDLPVLILTARDELPDRIRGLDAGADDYLVKPFAFVELLARVRALLRRAPDASRELKAGDIVIKLVTREVTRSGRVIGLTPREFELLAYLADHAGQVVARDALARDVWRETARLTSLDNVIDVHVSHLRRKLTDDSGDCPLTVVRGSGILLRSGA